MKNPLVIPAKAGIQLYLRSKDKNLFRRRRGFDWISQVRPFGSAFAGMTMVFFACALPLTACGSKGRLKSPAQIEAADAKKANKDAKKGKNISDTSTNADADTDADASNAPDQEQKVEPIPMPNSPGVKSQPLPIPTVGGASH